MAKKIVKDSLELRGDILDIIENAGGRIAQKDLFGFKLASNKVVTTELKKMEEDGMVAAETDPKSRKKYWMNAETTEESNLARDAEDKPVEPENNGSVKLSGEVAKEINNVVAQQKAKDAKAQEAKKAKKKPAKPKSCYGHIGGTQADFIDRVVQPMIDSGQKVLNIADIQKGLEEMVKKHGTEGEYEKLAVYESGRISLHLNHMLNHPHHEGQFDFTIFKPNKETKKVIAPLEEKKQRAALKVVEANA